MAPSAGRGPGPPVQATGGIKPGPALGPDPVGGTPYGKTRRVGPVLRDGVFAGTRRRIGGGGSPASPVSGAHGEAGTVALAFTRIGVAQDIAAAPDRFDVVVTARCLGEFLAQLADEDVDDLQLGRKSL